MKEALPKPVIRGDLSHVVDAHAGATPIIGDIAYMLVENRELLAHVQQKLADMGFRRFEFIGAGTVAMAMHTTRDQVVRIGPENDDYTLERPIHPAILQPICTEHIRFQGHAIRVEVLPKVRTEGVTPNHLRRLKEALRLSNLEVLDLGVKGNVGLMDVGGQSVPVVIDPGALKVINKNLPVISRGEHLFLWMDDRNRPLQEDFERRKRPRHVVDAEALETVEQVMRGPRSMADRVAHTTGRPDHRRVSQTVEAVREDGLYPDQLKELYTRAMAKHDDTTNFSELLKEERRILKDEMRPKEQGR